MKNYILLLSILIFTSQLKAQNAIEREQIIASYDMDKVVKSKENTLQYLSKQKQKIDSLVTKGTPRKIIGKNGEIYELMRVGPDGNPIYFSNNNTSAAYSTQTNTLHSDGGLGLNIEGQNMRVGVWDQQVALAEHQEFDERTGSRVTTESSSQNANSSHATHVTGTIIAKGQSPSAKGMAPKATAVSYDWNDDLIEVDLEIANNALLISNHSYGAPLFYNGQTNVQTGQIGTYGNEARNWDSRHYTYPFYLQVVSAGNDGEENNADPTQVGRDQLTGEKVAKNNLVIANAVDANIYENGTLYAIINQSSSKGPADDGRIKPDIAGNGTNVYSSISNESDPSILNGYASYSGTSMSAPNVAGSLLLLQQLHNELTGSYMKSSTLKGLVCHTAMKPLGTERGPDSIWGWGLLNTKASAELLIDHQTNARVLVRKLAENQSLQYNFELNQTRDIKITMCWTDPPGTSQTLNSLTPVLVNDLDITLNDNGNNYYPYKLNYNAEDKLWSLTTGINDVDNVEKIEILNAQPGTYTLTINHKGNLTNNNQEFSLFASGFDSSTLTNTSYADLGINIYPNPVNEGKIMFFGQLGNEKVSIYDIMGKSIWEGTIQNTIDISQYNAGIYFVKMERDFNILVKRIIVQ